LKLILSRLPVSYAIWSRLGIFRHSFQINSGRIFYEPRAHVQRYVAARGRLPRCVLELGPGELTARAVTYAALGVERTIFVDVADFGASDIAPYRAAAKLAATNGLDPPSLEDAADREAVLVQTRAHYLCDGLQSLRSLPPGVADLIVSDAVLEHVRKHELVPYLAELRRISAPDSLGRHGIDFHDHLGGNLNHLRFSEAVWESEWMATSGFYTNRISPSAMIGMMHQCGFRARIDYRLRWPAPPIAPGSISRDMAASWSDGDLGIAMLRLEIEPGEAQSESN
jgi:hypothetical protein